LKIAPTPLTAALAGAFAGILMPVLWARFGNDSLSLVLAFLLVVAVPAHAFVLGFGRSPSANARTIDTALLKRVGAWLTAAVVAMAIAQAVRS
jgi:hypothetical protein